MYLLLHQLLHNQRTRSSPLDIMLPRVVAALQEDFLSFADCGAGVGDVAARYGEYLRSSLDRELLPRARVYCYEPLPENLAVLQRRFSAEDLFKVRPVAVSDSAGRARFSVPHRVTADAGPWAAGTSFDGYLDATESPYHESIEVETVRLQDELQSGFDFVKMDLQGGELKALVGLGEMLKDVKLLYVETQFHVADHGPAYLRDQGFLVFFDRFQMGLDTSQLDIQLGRFEEIGFTIDRVYIPDGRGFPSMVRGYFTRYEGVLDTQRLGLSSEVKEAFESCGVTWMQTDTLAINPSIIGTAQQALTEL